MTDLAPVQRPPARLRLDSVFDIRGDDHTERTVAQAIVDFLAGGNSLDTACALVNVSRDTAYTWLRTGALHHTRMVEGRARRRDLTAHQRRCVDFSLGVRSAIARAEAGWVSQLVRLATEGSTVTTVVERTTSTELDGDEGPVDAVKVDRTVTTRTQPPDPRILTWLLERRFPDRWRHRASIDVDLDSAAIEDDGADPVEQFEAALLDVARRRTEARETLGEVIEATTVGTDSPATPGDDPL